MIKFNKNPILKDRIEKKRVNKKNKMTNKKSHGLVLKRPGTWVREKSTCLN
jgi:hypothetical protein